jgi:Ca2+-binding EF-hand superfamily protein
MEELKSRIREKVVAHTSRDNDRMRQAFKLFSQSKGIRPDEFKKAISNRFQLIASDQQIDALFREFDDDNSGAIDMTEFLRGLYPADDMGEIEKPKTPKKLKPAAFMSNMEMAHWDLPTIVNMLREKIDAFSRLDNGKFSKAFKLFCGTKETIGRAEFAATVQARFNMNLGKENIDRLFDKFDADGNGVIDKVEFIAGVLSGNANGKREDIQNPQNAGIPPRTIADLHGAHLGDDELGAKEYLHLGDGAAAVPESNYWQRDGPSGGVDFGSAEGEWGSSGGGALPEPRRGSPRQQLLQTRRQQQHQRQHDAFWTTASRGSASARGRGPEEYGGDAPPPDSLGLTSTAMRGFRADDRAPAVGDHAAAMNSGPVSDWRPRSRHATRSVHITAGGGAPADRRLMSQAAAHAQNLGLPVGAPASASEVAQHMFRHVVDHETYEAKRAGAKERAGAASVTMQAAKRAQLRTWKESRNAAATAKALPQKDGWRPEDEPVKLQTARHLHCQRANETRKHVHHKTGLEHHPLTPHAQ